MFGLNICMEITSERDFTELRSHCAKLKKRFPMFLHDVNQIVEIVENHIKEYSNMMVMYRQTRKQHYLEKAQHQIDEINRILSTVSKIELMALLSQG